MSHNVKGIAFLPEGWRELTEAELGYLATECFRCGEDIARAAVNARIAELREAKARTTTEPLPPPVFETSLTETPTRARGRAR